MICPNCAEENVDGIDVCESCGTDLAGLDTPEVEGGFRGQLLTDRIESFSLNPLLTISSQATVADAIEMMRKERHGCVLVEDDSRLHGIFTERDLLVRVVRKGLDPTKVKIDEVMTHEPVVLSESDPPAFAMHHMAVAGFRHLPITGGDGTPVGFASARTILKYLKEEVIRS